MFVPIWRLGLGRCLGLQQTPQRFGKARRPDRTDTRFRMNLVVEVGAVVEVSHVLEGETRFIPQPIDHPM